MKNNSIEIDDGKDYIGYREAFAIITDNIRPPGEEELSIDLCAGRIPSADITALVSNPSGDVSLKDGFAVRSDDVNDAAGDDPARLSVTGSAFAGINYPGEVKKGFAVKICSGAEIPGGADAVVSGEFCREVPPGEVLVTADAGPGRNILRAGIEVKAGDIVLKKGETLRPGRLGLATAAGIGRVRVYRRPRVAVISIGDEVVMPGSELGEGQLYASNMVTLEAWLASYGVPSVSAIVPDDEEIIKRELNNRLPDADVILTSGGAWGSERDLIIGVLNGLGWRQLFHYLRMGPGKGTAFGLWENVPVFCLPGGPGSSQMAFLQLALPAIMRMGGDARHPLQTIPARLTEDVKGRHPAWTEFKDAVAVLDEGGRCTVSLYKDGSRLRAIAGANALICIPEGLGHLSEGDVIPVQLLSMRLDAAGK